MSRKNKQSRKLARIAARIAQRNNPHPAPPGAEVISSAQQQLAKLAVQVERFSGPLPPPEVLEKYNAIEPGAANRIIRMAESQAQHRQSLERTVIGSRTRSEERAQILGTILALAIGGGAMGLVAMGYPVGGVVTLVAEVVALAGVFVYGRQKQQKELVSKTESIAPPNPV